MGSDLTPDQLAKRKEQLAHPIVPKVIKTMARVQVRVFKATGGRIGSKWRIGAGFRRPVATLLLDFTSVDSAAACVSTRRFVSSVTSGSTS